VVLEDEVDELKGAVLLGVDGADDVDEAEMELLEEAVEVGLEPLDESPFVVEATSLFPVIEGPAIVEDAEELVLVLLDVDIEDADETTLEDDKAEVEVEELLLEALAVPFLI